MKDKKNNNEVAVWDHTHSLDGTSELVWTDGNLGIGTATPTSTLVIGDNKVVINDDGKDVDFRIEGSTETNLFFVDGGRDEVLIKNSPVVTEDRLRSVVEDVLETKQENDLLKRFAQSLLERLYGEGE